MAEPLGKQIAWKSGAVCVAAAIVGAMSGSFGVLVAATILGAISMAFGMLTGKSPAVVEHWEPVHAVPTTNKRS